MAKTIEELKQMIDSVIVENGKGQITGQGLNLVLNEMSDALSEMGGGGGNVYPLMGDFQANTFTEEDKANNIEVRNKCIADINAGKIPSVSVSMGGMCMVVGGGYQYDEYADILMLFMMMGMGSMTINSDGTVTMD